MEAIANTILGILFVLCALTILSGISLWFKAIVLVITVAYLIIWIRELFKQETQMTPKQKALWYLTETILVPAIVSAVTTFLFLKFFEQ